MEPPVAVDAPWNAAWTDEMRWEVRPCRWAQGRPAMWQPWKPGSGRPVFASPHQVRQRRSVAQMLCTVCGKPTHEPDRWLFPLGDWRDIGGQKAWLTTEAPVHRACADHAMRVCPHLRALGFEPFPFPLVYQVQAQMVGGPAVEQDFGVRVPINNPVVGHLKIRLTAATVRRYVLPATGAQA